MTRTFKALVSCARTGGGRIVSDRVDVTPNGTTEAVAACPPGKRALGGGIDLIGSPSAELQMLANGPQGPSGTTATSMDGDPAVYWDGNVYNRGNRTRDFKVVAICAGA